MKYKKFFFTTTFLAIFWMSNGTAEETFAGFNKIYSQQLLDTSHSSKSVRIKDIARFEGARDNVLMGFGLVVGLNGTGDSLRNTLFTQQGLEAFLARLGINSNGANLKTKNVAAVAVTATLPPFVSSGHLIDVEVSAMGDASSLEGGMLLATPMMAANGKTYAVAQGSLLLGEIDTQRGNPRTSKGYKTKATVPDGGTVEANTGFKYDNFSEIKLILLNPDVKTSYNIADGINRVFEQNIAFPTDPANVVVKIPIEYKNSIITMLNRIGDISVEPDNAAKIVINEQTGTIVIGSDVRISKVALSQNNLNISIDDNVAIMESTSSLQSLVDGLNTLGFTTRDIIDVMYNLHSIGALQGQIILK